MRKFFIVGILCSFAPSFAFATKNCSTLQQSSKPYVEANGKTKSQFQIENSGGEVLGHGGMKVTNTHFEVVNVNYEFKHANVKTTITIPLKKALYVSRTFGQGQRTETKEYDEMQKQMATLADVFALLEDGCKDFDTKTSSIVQTKTIY